MEPAVIYASVCRNLRLKIFDFESSILNSLMDGELACFALLEVVGGRIVIDFGWSRLVVGVRFGWHRIGWFLRRVDLLVCLVVGP